MWQMALVVNDGDINQDNVKTFSFCTYEVPNLSISSFGSIEEYNITMDSIFGGDINNKRFIDVDIKNYEAICVELLDYDEEITIDEWLIGLHNIDKQLVSKTKVVFYKMKVVGNKFNYCCSKAGYEYFGNLYVEDFDEENGIKMQEFQIYKNNL